MDTGKFLNTTTGIGYAGNAGDAATGLAFNANGSLNLAGANTMNTGTLNAGKISVQVPVTNGSLPISLKFDMSRLTQFSNESSAAVTSKDGYAQGALDSFSIGPTGEVNGIFTNGQSKTIAQLALAAFKNPSGLEKTSENMFIATSNSGEPIVGSPGSSGLGGLNPGTLEMSNVDLSREFSEMISTQRGFQANSRIITTSDEMLQEMVNLKR